MGGLALLVRRRSGTGAGALAAVVLLQVACADGGGTGRDLDKAHADLACAACHQGNVADTGMPSVPGSTCASSSCHGERVPGEISLSTVTFQHRSHGAEADVALGCAGCHTHGSGSEPITAGVDACGLCHAGDLGGETGQTCTECHGHPEVVTATSQGVPVPHEGLPWISRSCVRCHYDVAQPPPHVPMSRCRTCHEDATATAAQAVGRDLHRGHTGVACVSCHEPQAHRIVAMSSAVSLECMDCHRNVHDVDVPRDWPAENCISCHQESHQAQQRLLLGLAGQGLSPTPSEKFMDGLVCRSCHVSRPGSTAEAVSAGAEGCVGCHEPRYARVLGWWREGLSQRDRVASGYVRQGRAALGQVTEPDSVGILLNDSEALLSLVKEGGGEHNLRLAHRLFTRAVERTSRAYELAGRSPPEQPYLGRQPSMGICSYCHYRLDDPMEFQIMPEDFHVRVMGR